MIDKIENLIEELTDNFIAVIVVVAYLAMVVQGMAIPDGLNAFVGLVMAYYFTKKQQ